MERKSGELVSTETIEALTIIQNKREVSPSKPLPPINATPKSDDDIHVKVFKRINSFPRYIDVDIPSSPIDIEIPSRK